MLIQWDDLPKGMKNDEVREYYDILSRHRLGIRLKRFFDLFFATVFLGVCAIPMLVISILIIVDSPGGAFYTQERVTSYGKIFRIHKFRTMVANAEKIGSSVTVSMDGRITKMGSFLRKYRLDELPQLFDIITGNMSFVGTRPEVVKYVKKYTPEMRATLLLPAGVTSEASIRYKNESDLLQGTEDVDKVYIRQILPMKMKYNLQAIKEYSFIGDMITIFRTVLAVLGKEYD